MLPLSYGFQKPEVTDQGGIVFPALEANWQQVNDHNHDGVNSALIAGLSLPSQTGNSGKFLTTNGVSPSWGAIEVITASNVGGAVGLFKQKTLADLEFKTIEAGTNITLDTTDPSKVVINASGGGGGVFTVAPIKTVVTRVAGTSLTYVGAPDPAYNYALGFDTVDSDPGAVWNNTNKEWVIPAGYTGAASGRVTFNFWVTANQSGYYILQKFDTGTSAFVTYRTGTGNTNNTGAFPKNMTIEFDGAVAGDRFRLIYEYGFGAPTFQSGASVCWAVFTIDAK
jgi:hypothetical protein